MNSGAWAASKFKETKNNHNCSICREQQTEPQELCFTMCWAVSMPVLHYDTITPLTPCFLKYELKREPSPKRLFMKAQARGLVAEHLAPLREVLGQKGRTAPRQNLPFMSHNVLLSSLPQQSLMEHLQVWENEVAKRKVSAFHVGHQPKCHSFGGLTHLQALSTPIFKDRSMNFFPPVSLPLIHLILCVVKMLFMTFSTLLFCSNLPPPKKSRAAISFRNERRKKMELQESNNWIFCFSPNPISKSMIFVNF